MGICGRARYADTAECNGVALVNATGGYVSKSVKYRTERVLCALRAPVCLPWCCLVSCWSPRHGAGLLRWCTGSLHGDVRFS